MEHKQDRLLLGKFFCSSPSFTYFRMLMSFLSSQYEQGGFSSRSLLLDQHIADHIDRVRALVFLSQVPYDDVGGLRPSWLLVL